MNIQSTSDRWWERFYHVKTNANNQHDWLCLWADIKLSGKSKAIFYDTTTIHNI